MLLRLDLVARERARPRADVRELLSRSLSEAEVGEFQALEPG
jgi:hypothetical protein